MKPKTTFKQTEIDGAARNKKTLNELIGFLLKILEKVREETENVQKEKIYVWSEHFSNWIEIWRYFDKHIGKEKFLNSFLGFRLTQLNKELLWFLLECNSGVYDNAIRDLRYILESFLQAYYIDGKYPKASMEDKLGILENSDNLTGGGLIKNLDIDDEYKQQINNLYKALCKYIHPSYDEWKQIISNGKLDSKLTFSYDKESFEKSVELTNRVIDVVVFLLLNFCPKMLGDIKKDEIFLKSISDVENSLVIQYIAQNKV